VRHLRARWHVVTLPHRLSSGWVEEHDRLLGSAFEWPSEEVKAAFVADGRQLLARVRAELGPDYEVVYFDEITGRVEGP
jgi:hypothetical protein